MDRGLGLLIKQTAEEMGISNTSAKEVFNKTNKVLLSMMNEADAKNSDNFKRIFLRNIGTYDVPKKVRYALKQKYNENI